MDEFLWISGGVSVLKCFKVDIEGNKQTHNRDDDEGTITFKDVVAYPAIVDSQGENVFKSVFYIYRV